MNKQIYKLDLSTLTSGVGGKPLLIGLCTRYTDNTVQVNNYQTFFNKLTT